MDLQDRDRKIVDMRRAGHILTDIAIETECSVPTVMAVLDTKYKTRQEERDERKDMIVRLRSEGWSIGDISDEVQCSSFYVYQTLHTWKERQ